MNTITNELRVARVIARDPLGGGTWMPGRWIRTWLDHVPSVESEEFVVCPVLLAHPADDRWTDVSVSRPFFDRLTVEKRLVLLDDTGHLPIERPSIDQLHDASVDFLATAAGHATNPV